MFNPIWVCFLVQVHHGGAGTTAAGLKAAVHTTCYIFLCFFQTVLIVVFKTSTCYCFTVQCPTTIVPFFGDQPFWGDRVHARGVGPAPIPIGQFSLPKLIDAIKFMLDPEVPSNHCIG